MAERPWLTIIGLGEDGLEGLSPASLAALKTAEIVMGPERHMALLGDGPWQRVIWPVPFADGVAQLLAMRGQRVVVLASGDPFWFGAGSVLTRHLGSDEWVAIPGASCFSLAASHLGWPLEQTMCLGLHAAPLTRLRPHLAPGQRLLVTLRDGEAPAGLAAYLTEAGFGASPLWVLQALGGPRERVDQFLASEMSADARFAHPLCVAIEVAGDGAALPKSSGLDDNWFEHDGQITKRPIRALTLSALAPQPGEHLWDIGGGSGSIAIEWLLAHPTMSATCIEADPTRAARIRATAERLGVDRLAVAEGEAPQALVGLTVPDVVFIGGGLSDALLAHVTALETGTRVVANAVTLEAEALLTQAQAQFGGALLRIDMAQAAPLGRKRGWRASFPIVQWSVTL